jgi:subtilisin-like proprotein convertase family protein
MRHFTVLAIALLLTLTTTYKLKGQAVPCQPSTISFDLAACNPQPVLEGGVYYFNICHGSPVTIAVKGDYPQNNTNYTQSDNLHSYYWIFGDGIIQTIHNTPIATHLYADVKGYDFKVTMTDTNFCASNQLAGRIRVAGDPIQGFVAPPPYCFDSQDPGDTITINLSTIATVHPFTYQLVSSQKYDKVTFIPDGPTCTGAGGTQCYNTNVTFESFTAGQTLTQATDLLSVCITMEHTYIGDLTMKLICPNGQSTLLQNRGGGSKWMGQAIDDVGGDKCDPKTNPAGKPYNYCWTQSYPTTSILANGPTQPYNGNSVIDSSNRVTHGNYYAPIGDFTSLIGCPLNGEWNIEICDAAGQDNGWVFEWELNLNPALLPQSWSYTVPVDSSRLEGVGVIGQETPNSYIQVPEPGTYDYTFYTVDTYGCTFSIPVQVVSNPSPEAPLGADQTACFGESVELSGTNCANCTYLWNNGFTTSSITVTASGVYSRQVRNQYNCTSTDSVEVVISGPVLPMNIKHN